MPFPLTPIISTFDGAAVSPPAGMTNRPIVSSGTTGGLRTDGAGLVRPSGTTNHMYAGWFTGAQYDTADGLVEAYALFQARDREIAELMMHLTNPGVDGSTGGLKIQWDFSSGGTDAIRLLSVDADADTQVGVDQAYAATSRFGLGARHDGETLGIFVFRDGVDNPADWPLLVELAHTAHTRGFLGLGLNLSGNAGSQLAVTAFGGGLVPNPIEPGMAAYRNVGGVATLLGDVYFNAGGLAVAGVAIRQREALDSWQGFATRPPDAAWRAYSADGPWNIPVEEPEVHPDSAEMVANVLAATAGKPGNLTTERATGDVFHPIYWAATSDPLLTISAGRYLLTGTQIRVPAGAVPALGSDGHIYIVQPDGWEYAFGKATIDGSTLRADYAYRVRADGPGIVTPAIRGGDYRIGGTTASYFAGHAGIIRGAELVAGRIDHALMIAIEEGALGTEYGFGTVAPGANGSGGDGSSIWPSYKGDAISIDRGNPLLPPMGARLWLDMTPEEIDACTSTRWERTIAHAMATFGGYFGDTGGSGFMFQFESHAMYTSIGRENPFRTLAVSLGLRFSEVFGYTYVFRDGTQTTTPIPWAERLRFIAPPEH